MSKKKQRNKRYNKAWKKAWIEGWQQGFATGELDATRTILLDIIEIRFPTSIEMAKRRVQQIQSSWYLCQLVTQIVIAPDEKTALHALIYGHFQKLAPIPTINDSAAATSL